MTELLLFWEFLKIGLFSVGGGMATLPFLYDLSDRTGWFSHADIADMLAVSESTPGPIGINMATYAGYTVSGIPGALAASIGIIIPGLFLVILVTAVLGKFRENRIVNGAFYGLRAASVGLIAAAGLLVCRITFLEEGAKLDLRALALALLLLVLTRFVPKVRELHPAVFIAFSALIGIVFSF